MSPRPRKHRRCHCPFKEDTEVVFKPAAIPLKDLAIEIIFHDEIEAVNLCDGMGLTQEEAGLKMGISRGTVQRLVTAGRRKIIKTIVDHKALLISQEQETGTVDNKQNN